MLAIIFAFIGAATCGVLAYQDIRDRKWFDAAFFGVCGIVSAVAGVFLIRISELAWLAQEASR